MLRDDGMEADIVAMLRTAGVSEKCIDEILCLVALDEQRRQDEKGQ
jgi:hypothetical protein